MSTVTVSPELQALVDAGHITVGQAAEAMAAAPAPGEIAGRAVCMTSGCESFGAPRSIALRRDVREQRAPDLANLVISSTEYLVALDDSELTCPDCNLPCALQESEPPRYQKMLAV